MTVDNFVQCCLYFTEHDTKTWYLYFDNLVQCCLYVHIYKELEGTVQHLGQLCAMLSISTHKILEHYDNEVQCCHYFTNTRTNLQLGQFCLILTIKKAYFFANEIFIVFVGVILKPCKASLAAPACTSFSNSTNAMSWRPGTSRTSLNPGNLK